MLRLEKKAQSTLEYAIIIAVVVGAAIAMQVYVKRGLQGRVRDAVNWREPSSVNILTGNQYEPAFMNQQGVTNQYGWTSENLQLGGGVVKTGNEQTRASRNQVFY